MNPPPLNRSPALAKANAKRRERRSHHPFFRVALIVGLSLGMSDPSRAQTAPSTPAVPLTGHPNDAHIAEASQRFGIPEAWIRAVMRVESAGDPAATSHAGAMGLMQVMPGTYAELRARYGLDRTPMTRATTSWQAQLTCAKCTTATGRRASSLRTMQGLAAGKATPIVVVRCLPKRSPTWPGWARWSAVRSRLRRPRLRRSIASPGHGLRCS